MAESFEGKNVLVGGGAGFVGSNFVRRDRAAGPPSRPPSRGTRNQWSFHDLMADRENNSLTTLRLFERLKETKSRRKRDHRGRAGVSQFHDSPCSISKLIGEMYGNSYQTCYGMPFVKARFQNAYGGPPTA